MPASLKNRSRAGSASSEFTHISPEYSHIPPEYIHRAIPMTTDFPTPTGQPFAVTKRDQGLVSPAQSSFSFADNETPLHTVSTPPSPSRSPNATSNPPNGMDENIMASPIDRGTPGEGLPSPTSRMPQEKELATKRNQYYRDIFAAREESSSPEEQVHKNSIISVEVKTNVIVRDEFRFLDELSIHLSQRYQRPISSIFIQLEHSACFLFAGTFESAYILTITALSSQLLPATNKTNTALIQSHLATSLGVLPDRGIIRFSAITDDHFAIAGTTYLGHVERLQRKQGEIDKKEIVRNNSLREPQPVTESTKVVPTVRKKSSQKSLSIRPPLTGVTQRQVKSTPGSRVPSPVVATQPIPAIPWDNNNPQDQAEEDKVPDMKRTEKKVEKVQKLGKRKSFFAIFSRG